MNDIIIKFEGDEVIIRGPKSILKIVIDPTVEGIQKITGPEITEMVMPIFGRPNSSGLLRPMKVKSKKGKRILLPENIAKNVVSKNFNAGREKRYYCLDCKQVFFSKSTKLDAVCPECNSVHIGYAVTYNK